jgi:hypothetical protein
MPRPSSGDRPARSVVLDRIVVRKQVWLDALLVAVMTGAFVLLRSTHPSAAYVGTHESWGLPPCTFRLLLDLPCPGCGVTTGLAYMTRGQIADACVSNLLSPALFTLGAWIWLQGLAVLLARRRLVVFLPVWLERRLPWYGLAYIVMAYAVKVVSYRAMGPTMAG